MVVGGNLAENQVEIVDLSGLNLTCPDIPDHPVRYGSVGIFVNDAALVCGGYDGQTPHVGECYSYDNVVGMDCYFTI